METKDKIQIASLLLISIFIIVLIVAIVVLVKNADEIKNNPVQYAIDKDFYDSCLCSDKDIGLINFNKEMVINNWTS